MSNCQDVTLDWDLDILNVDNNSFPCQNIVTFVRTDIGKDYRRIYASLGPNELNQIAITMNDGCLINVYSKSSPRSSAVRSRNDISWIGKMDKTLNAPRGGAAWDGSIRNGREG